MGKKIKIPLGSRGPRGSKSVKSSKGSRAAVQKRPLKGPKKPVSQQRRDSTSSLSSAPNLSDEDGYSAVEDVPDSDDDEDEHVFAAEMEHIIANRQRDLLYSSTRPGHESDEENQAVADEDGSEDDMADEESFLEEELEEISSEYGGDFSSAEEALAVPLEENPEQTPERHVRFIGVPDSDSDDETEDDHDDVFKDIFVPLSTLDPGLRREIEMGDDSDCSDTCWDYSSLGDGYPWKNDVQDGYVAPTGEGTPTEPLTGFMPIQNPMGPIPPPASVGDEDEESSEGYETDGETTEEDEPVLIPRRQTTPEASGQGNADTAGNERSPAGRLLFKLSRKPICVLNPITLKIMVIRPKKQARIQTPIEQLLASGIFTGAMPDEQSPLKQDVFMWTTPMQFNQDMPMLSSELPFDQFFNLDGDLIAESGEDSVIDEDMDFEAKDDGEENLRLEDFINLDNLEEFCAPDDETSDDAQTNGDESSSRRPSITSNGNGLTGSGFHENALLKHFEKTGFNTVGAFRINQDNQKLIANGIATKESLGFSNSLYHGTLRGIKQGNFKAAATPLTPERRHKKAPIKSPLETNRKRKASEVDNNDRQKRHNGGFGTTSTAGWEV